MYRTQFAAVFFVIASCALGSLSARADDDYRKAVESSENVLNKRFSKKKNVELSVGGGGIINQSYIQSYMIGGTLNYFLNEVWGFGVEGNFFLNSDKSERTCVENFYNDFNGTVEAATGRVCSPDGDPTLAGQDLAEWSSQEADDKPANMGPAYVPIRQKNFSVGAHVIWNPIYGKQLLMLSSTGYFDVFLKGGAGVMMGDYYMESKDLRNGVPSRATTTTPTVGTAATDTDNYGEAGRPDVQSETNIYVMLALGQKYHFFKKMHLSFELKNYTLLFTTDSGFDNFLTLSGGVGMRF